MSERLHLRAVEDAQADAVWFVLRRANGTWSVAAHIIAVCSTREEARAEIERLHRQSPDHVFAAAPILFEARKNPNVTEVVERGEAA